jgi:ABC-type nitrate/sulfonate/bicarbonate transport system substrate-binding protein
VVVQGGHCLGFNLARVLVLRQGWRQICLAAEAGPERARGVLVRIAIPDLISNSYFPAIAADQLGLFKAEGLDLRLELLFPVTSAMLALREGDLDFVVGTASATLTAFPDWRGARLLAAVAQRMYWFLVLRADLNVSRGNVQAVRGLRIGAAPGVDVGLKRLLRAVGIDPERDVSIAPVPGASAGGVSFGVTAAQALADGQLDGFWANGMGAAVAVRRGVGTMVLDVRRGDGPPDAADYTFPALVTREDLIEQQPQAVSGAIRAIIRAQQALRANPSLATQIGERVFPPMEAALIGELISRDLPYYDPAISHTSFDGLTRFAIDMGLLSRAVPYDDVVAGQFQHLWRM